MLAPSEYRILRNLQDTIGQIKIANGYYHDVASTAVKLNPDQAAEEFVPANGPRPFVLLELMPEAWEYSLARVTTIYLGVTIYFVNNFDLTEDSSGLETCFNGFADVETVISKDITRGGLASYTQITNRSGVVFRSEMWAKVETKILTHRIFGKPSCE